MSMDPSKMAVAVDLLTVNGTSKATSTGTRAFDAVGLPPGKKAVQISLVTSATVTLNLQHSLDKTNWFSVYISTNSSAVVEVDSVVPFWRINCTAHATSGTGSDAAMTALITQGPT
jgi:hypothetical protein